MCAWPGPGGMTGCSEAAGHGLTLCQGFCLGQRACPDTIPMPQRCFTSHCAAGRCPVPGQKG